jgi:mannose-6-phosphate isomerase-like protein (cupin superfamily)
MFEETETLVPIIRTRDDHETVRVVKGVTRFLVHGREVSDAYAIIEQIIPPGGGPPMHVHRHETEIFFVVEGQFEIVVGDQTVTGPAGASAVCPRDIPHTFRNISDVPARLTVTIIPGHFGEFFERVDSVDPDNHDAIRDLAAEYGVEVFER